MKHIIRACLLVTLSLILTLTACGQAALPAQSINDILQPIRDMYDLPALAAAVISDGRIIAEGAVGVRKYGDKIPVTLDDQFHLGSCTKALTATLIAILVEQGKLSWNKTLVEYFPEMADKMLPRYRDVTLLHLLSHHSGLQGNTDTNYPASLKGVDFYNWIEPITQQRYEGTRALLCRPSEEVSYLPEPGTTYLYSNFGYVVAGAVAERVTGKSWEELMTTLLFQPLGMTTAGFGPMGTDNQVDQPWQHSYSNGTITPISPDNPHSDLPRAMGPAGMVHMSVRDWAKFIIMHLEGEKGGSKLLKPETFKILHTPPSGIEYALGWFVNSDGMWMDGTVFFHGGTNMLNRAYVCMSPEYDFAVLVTSNMFSSIVEDACTTVLVDLIKKYLPKK